MDLSPSPSTGRSLALVRASALAGVLILVGILTVLSLSSAPLPNGLGITPSTESLLVNSGITLNLPSRTALISRRQAITVGERQSGGEPVERAFLATAVGLAGSDLAAPGKLCWVVFLAVVPDQYGNALAPGTVNLDVVLVNAQTGRFMRGFIAFSPSTPQSGVGSE